MKKLEKLFGWVLLLAMIVSSLSGLTTVSAAEAQPQARQTTVAVHKILMNKADFEAFNHDTAQNTEAYNGNQIRNLTGYFGASAREIEGVNFKVYKKLATNEATEGSATGISLGIANDSDRYKLVDNTGVTTNAQGIAEFTLADGTYIFVEDKAASPYYNTTDAAGNELTGMKAIPFKLELPLTKPDGNGYFSTQDKLHVYPKNTEAKPTITKTFGDDTTETKNTEIGKVIPYKVVTTIPKDAAYKTLVWEDFMLTGLDFTEGSLQIQSNIDGFGTSDYSLTQNKRGFTLKLNEQGLTKVENKAKEGEVTFTLTYNATLNDSAIVETEIPNTIKLHYGNRPNEISDPKEKPVTPSNNEITVTKTWGEGITKKEVKFGVYEKLTGFKAGEITLSVDEASDKLGGLKANVEYIVIEETPVDKSLPTYDNAQEGTMAVANNKNPNPSPLVPQEPKVKTYGKRFVKTNNENADSSSLAKLGGAEFVVKNGQGKFLALKDATTQAEQVRAYKEAQAAYLEAVKTSTDVDNKKNLRDRAYEAMNMQWTWVEAQAQAFTFISSASDGRFEVKGLEPGTYKLVETKAPTGYALPSDEIEFSVGQGTWNDTQGIEGHMQVRNKTVLIPQTGGMGTIIFMLVGAAVMGYAFIAIKKYRREA